MADIIPGNLQFSLLVVLTFFAKEGAKASAILRPEHFDSGDFHYIAERVLRYWRDWGEPPGEAHLDDIFGWSLERGERSQRLRRLMGEIVRQRDLVNADYVVGNADKFILKQNYKSITAAICDRMSLEGDEDWFEDVQALFHKATRERREGFDAGLFLDDEKRALRFLDRDESDFYPLGIPALDKLGIGARPKSLMLYIGPKNSGKSWFAVHMGVQCVMRKGTVAHITLEMDEDQVSERYHDRLFAAGSNPTYEHSVLDVDEKGAVTRVGATVEERDTPLWLYGENGRKELRKERGAWGTRLGRINIKKFPSGKLTISQLVGHLDALANQFDFVPNMLIVDYPDLMKVPRDNFRLELGGIYVDLRGLGDERNMAIVTPTQGNRSSLRARRVQGTMISESVDKLYTADTVLFYSQTESEYNKNLARLEVGYSRTTKRSNMVVITQAYGIGQWVTDSADYSEAYRNKMSGEGEDDDD